MTFDKICWQLEKQEGCHINQTLWKRIYNEVGCSNLVLLLLLLTSHERAKKRKITKVSSQLEKKYRLLLLCAIVGKLVLCGRQQASHLLWPISAWHVLTGSQSDVDGVRSHLILAHQWYGWSGVYMGVTQWVRKREKKLRNWHKKCVMTLDLDYDFQA